MVCLTLLSVLFCTPLLVIIIWWFIKPPTVLKIRRLEESKVTSNTKNRFIVSKVPKNIDVIIVGSGMGGMAAASILSQNGKKVIVLERHDKLGGCTHTFPWSNNNNDGSGYTSCEFDTGCHYCAVDLAFDTARSGTIMKYVTDNTVKFNDLGDPYDRLVLPQDNRVDAGCPNYDTYNFLCGSERLVEDVARRINPNEPEVKRRISKFLEFCYTAKETITLLFFVRMLPRFMERFLKFVEDNIIKYGTITTNYTMDAMISHGFSNNEVLAGKSLPSEPEVGLENTWRRCKGVMIHPLGDYACQPRYSSIVAHALTSWYYMDGASYTHGATQTISESAAKVVYEYGGECFVNATVDEIIIENGCAVGVRVCKSTSFQIETIGENPEMYELRAPTIINATGIHNLYNRLLPEDLPLAKEFKSTNKSIPSFGHIYLFVAIKGDPEEVGIPKTNTWYFNGYDTDECFDKYFEDPVNHRPPTVYLGFPCTKDQTWKERHPGISNCIMISDGKYEWFQKWEHFRTHKRGEEYDQLKEKFAEKLLEVLYDKVPQTKGKVLWYEVGTPISDANFLTSYKGGSYGTRCNIDYFSRDSLRWLMRGDTEIKGLYMAGQDAWTPAVAGALYGGLLGSMKVLGTLKAFGLLLSLINSQAEAIHRKKSWFYPYCFYKAVRTFLGEPFLR